MSQEAVQRGWVDAVLDRLEPPPGAWGFALRVWLAMVVALYAGFWLQLESASSAAVTVAILAQPRRGQALSKAFYRILGTLVGFVVSIAFAGLFGQDRVLLLLSFGVWLGLCVFAANYMQGTRAYGAMLSGYTVAIIAIANIDTPQMVFETGIERVAAITLGVIAIALVNDAFGSPDVFPTVRDAIGKAREAAREFARRALTAGPPAPDASGDLLKQISAPRADIQAVVGEFSDGIHRVAGARSTIAALFAQVAAARAFARATTYDRLGSVPEAELDALRARIRDGLADDREALADLEARAQAIAADPASTPERVLLHRRAADILRQDDLAGDGLRALDGGGPPRRHVTLPIHRDFPDALRNAARVVVAYAISAAFFILSGWPATANGLLQISATSALSAVVPNPAAFGTGVLIAMPLAVLLAGVAKFFVLDGGQGFVMLALTLLPVIVVGCFLSLRPGTFTVGFILIVFFPVALGPSNPQTYDPQAYLNTGTLFIAAAVLLFLGNQLVLPTNDRQRRLWSLQSARADILEALRGEPKEAWERVNLDADRLAQFAGRQWRSAIARRAGLRHAFALAGLDTAAAGAQAALNQLARAPGFDRPVRDARRALAHLDVAGLRKAAADLIAATAQGPEAVRRAASLAVADLTAASYLLSDEHRALGRLGIEAGRETAA